MTDDRQILTDEDRKGVPRAALSEVGRARMEKQEKDYKATRSQPTGKLIGDDIDPEAVREWIAMNSTEQILVDLYYEVNWHRSKINKMGKRITELELALEDKSQALGVR